MAVGRKKFPDPRRPQKSFYRMVPFVFGGVGSGSRCKDTVEYYDARARAWKPAAKMPAPRCSAVAVTAASGLIYLVGGSSGGLSVETVDIYHPATDTWQSPAPSLQKPLEDHGAVAMSDGSIYVFGGRADSSQYLEKAVYWFQEGGSNWSRIADMPAPKSYAVAMVVGEHVYVFGVAGGVNVFKPKKGKPREGKWRSFQSAPVEVKQGAVVDGRIYLLQDELHSSELLRYTPSSNPLVEAGTWIGFGGPTKPLLPLMSATGFDESLYLSGGYNRFVGYSERAERLKFPERLRPPGPGSEFGTTEKAQPGGGSWTAWLNRDLPSGSGDYETLKDFRALNKVCAAPSKVQCRTVKGKLDWRSTGQVVTCSTKSGGVCVNRKNGGACRDYEVRFFCE